VSDRAWYAVGVIVERPDGWASHLRVALLLTGAANKDEARGIAVADALRTYPDYALKGVTVLRVPDGPPPGEPR
jgi:hypothetical protein